MGTNFRADAVFQRGNDFSARGVVLGIGGKNQQDIERQAQRVAFNLNVAFLHDVEEADLNFSREVGQFVDGKNSAIGARQQSIVNGEFVGEIAAAAGGANGIHVADDVGHGDVGSGEFFDIAKVARHPGDGRIVALGGDAIAAGAADRAQRVVVDFAARNDGNFGIEKIGEAAEDAALGLAAQAKQNKIMPGKQRVHDLRDDGVFVAVNAGEERLAAFDGAQEISANFVLHGARGGTRIEIRNTAQFAESGGFGACSGRMRRW